jgi:hypothetical protein
MPYYFPVSCQITNTTQLFEQQQAGGNVASGAKKESAIQSAAEMALKMYMQSQGSGGASGLMGMASKFF